MTVQRKKRRLKSTRDPIMDVGQKKRASLSAGVTRRDPKAAAPAAGNKAAGNKAAGTKAAGTKPRTPKATHPADQKFDAERKAFREGQKGKGKAAVVKKDLKTQLAERMDAFNDRIKNHKTAADLQMKLIDLREKVQKDNLVLRQKATKTNVERRLAARLKAMQARKPKIDGNKVVVPKAEKPTYTKVEPKLKAVPRIEKGKITYKPRVAKPKDPGAVAAGKKAAKTAAKSGPKAA